jgi:hypothetical protein
MPAPLADAPAPGAINDAFLSVLPRIVRQAAFTCRNLRCPHRRADAVQEVVALAWLAFVRAARLGREGRAFASLPGRASAITRCDLAVLAPTPRAFVPNYHLRVWQYPVGAS